MSQEKFWVLLSKKLSNEASASELEELQGLIVSHPEWQYAIQNLEDLWKHQPGKDSLLEDDAFMLHMHRMTELGTPLESPQNSTPFSTAKKFQLKWYWAAAAIIVIAIAGWRFVSNSKGKEDILADQSSINEISTRPGSKSKIQLPDGSTVWLNAGSKLSYNKDFGTGVREVSLSGEGFFDVVKMNGKPFVIHTSSINIKVLGTAFNVKAYPDDKKTETSLIRGSVEVTIKNRPNDKIILSPSEKLVVENDVVVTREKRNATADVPDAINPMMSLNKLTYNPSDSAVVETQWIENKLVFRDESFDELVVRLERWYDVEIELNDPKIKEKRISGSFQNETIDQALEALKISIPFRHEKTGKKILIHR